MKKRVALIHFRTGERDGVGLELERRAQLIRKLGGEVFYITGFDAFKRRNAFIIPEIDFSSNLNKLLRENFFYQKILDEHLVVTLYSHLEHKLYKKIDKAFTKIQPDLAFIHNFFSLPYNLPMTAGLIKILDKYQVPTVAVHHDFWFENPQLLKPKFAFIKEILETIPPKRPYILKHQVLSSIAQQSLAKRRKIKAEIIGDSFNFSQPQPKVDEFNQDLRKYFGIAKNDLVVLQATRIVPRKAIENTIYFVRFLEKYLRKQTPIKINGKLFGKTNRVFLLSSNFYEADCLEYYRQLKILAEKLEVNALWKASNFASRREQIDGRKTFGFWDAYIFADLVAYPSVWEGFGNQFLETIFFRKLPIVFEYPVFKKDIKKEGYEYVSLGNKVKKKSGLQLIPQTTIQQAAQETIRILKNPEKIRAITTKNFKIAQKHHDTSHLAKDLEQILKEA